MFFLLMIFTLMFEVHAHSDGHNECLVDSKMFCPEEKTPQTLIPCLEEKIDKGLEPECNKFVKERKKQGLNNLDEIIHLCDSQFKVKCKKDPKGINLDECYKTAKFEGRCLEKLKELKKVN